MESLGGYFAGEKTHGDPILPRRGMRYSFQRSTGICDGVIAIGLMIIIMMSQSPA